jgi:hypothetical protein
MRAALLAILFFASCSSTHNHTMADEAYAQRYGTGGSGTTGGSGLNVAPLVNALFSRIDNAPSVADKKVHCADLFRRLSNHDAAAYEWQGYYTRCENL